MTKEVRNYKKWILEENVDKNLGAFTWIKKERVEWGHIQNYGIWHDFISYKIRRVVLQ